MPVKFGKVLGIADGVPAFSSDYDSADASEYPTRHSYMSLWNGYYCGYRYQCVEYARRYLLAVLGVTFADVGMAYEIFELRGFAKPRPADVTSFSARGRGERLPIVRWANGASVGSDSGAIERVLATHALPHDAFVEYAAAAAVARAQGARSAPSTGAAGAAASAAAPQPAALPAEVLRTLCLEGDAPVDVPHLPRRGSLMIWRAGGWFRHTGHVAVVTEVLIHAVVPDAARGGNVVRGVIRVAEQNVHDRSWDGRTYSRELPFGIAPDGTLTVLDTYPNTVVLGWVTSLTTGSPIPVHA